MRGRALLSSTCVTALLGALLPSIARADTDDVAAAEALFRSGKELLTEQDFAHACPKLAESFRLDPGTGTLLSLAICHERAGKLASAWGEYSEAASRSKVEGRADRERAARGKVAELEPKISTLTIIADVAATPGLEIRRDGVVIGPAWLGTPIPVDGGVEAIDATAPGKRPFHADVTVGPSGDKQIAAVPTLLDAPVTKGPDAAGLPALGSVAPSGSANGGSSAPPPLSSASEPSQGGLTGLQTTGVVVGVVGLASLGVGTYFGLHALSLKDDANGQCDASNNCSPSGASDLSSAVTAGNVATVTLIAGGVLTATGITLLAAFHRGSEAPQIAPATVQLLPNAEPHGFGAVLRATF